MTRRLILLRHGQTEYNATRRMQGHLDTVLSDAGWSQAEAAADFLATLPIGKIISSDLARARDTAAVVGKRLGIDVTTDPRLRETDLGEWQAKTIDEVDTDYPGARAIWRHDATWAPPVGNLDLMWHTGRAPLSTSSCRTTTSGMIQACSSWPTVGQSAR